MSSALLEFSYLFPSMKNIESSNLLINKGLYSTRNLHPGTLNAGELRKYANSCIFEQLRRGFEGVVPWKRQGGENCGAWCGSGQTIHMQMI
jgi:hypothetical protein